MKNYLKIYFITALSSVLCVVFLWGLDDFGVLSTSDVVECSIVAAIVALVFAIIYVIRKVKSWKARLLIILFNPVIYYIIFWIWFLIAFSREASNEGFHPGNMG